MRLIKSVGQKLVINEDSEVASSLGSCYRRTCDKCKELLPMIARPEQHVDEKPSGSFLRISNFAMPIIALAKPSAVTVPSPNDGPTSSRKTPKFPSRQRQLAIKRKKSKPKRITTDGEDNNNADEDYDDDDDDEIESVQTVEDDLNDEEVEVNGCNRTSCDGDFSSEL